MLESRVVYFDDRVRDASGKWIGGSWIGLDKASRVAKYLENKDFVRKGSSELGKWMTNVVSSGQCGASTLVFAQDIAPYDVLDEFSPNALVRQYLDNGGTVLWMGDIPFYYRTESKNGHSERNTFRTLPKGTIPMTTGLAHLELLGIVPVSMFVGSRFSITRNGQRYGLSTGWPSLRPIVSPSNFETDRTKITNVLFGRSSFIELAHAEGIGILPLQPMCRKGHLRRLLEFLGTSSIETGPVKITSDRTESSGMESAMKYISAWIKRFDTRVPGSGFIRIWDFSPRIITDSMLEEMCVLIQTYCGNKTSQER
jgi:hypothetical protein